jgi:ABC-type branched-subunit amino acid transport system substrate-binding protein
LFFGKGKFLSFILNHENEGGGKMKKALFVWIIMVFAFCGSVAGHAEAKTLQIGVLHSLTGWFSGWDTTSLNETKVVADIINERGGITVKGQPYKIELVVEDGKSSLDGVAAAANALVYDRKVKFILGPAAFFARAVGPIVTQNHVINVLGYHTYTPEEIGPGQPYTFSGTGGAPGHFYSMVKVLQEDFPDVKNLCMVSPVGGIHPRLEKFMRTELGKLGYNIVGEWVVFPDDAVDWSPYAAKIKANKEADAVFWLHAITFHVGNMVKSLREIGYDKWVLVGSNAGPGIVDIAGKEAATKVITATPILNATGNSPDLDEMMRRMEAKYGSNIDTILESSQALYVLAQILEKAQSLDPTAVKEKWESMDGQTVDSLYGPVVISGTKTFGIKGHAAANAWPGMLFVNGTIFPIGWFGYTLP